MTFPFLRHQEEENKCNSSHGRHFEMMSRSPFFFLKSLSYKLQLLVVENKVFSTMHHNLISQLLGQGKQYSYFIPIMSRVLHFMNSHFKKNDLKQEHLFYGDQDRRGFVKKHS